MNCYAVASEYLQQDTKFFLSPYMVLGGIGSILGPPIGAAAAILVLEVFRFMLELTPAVLGLVVIVIIIFLPDGLISTLSEIKKLLRNRQ